MDIKIIRSARKSVSIEITRDLQILVRAPIFASNRNIQDFIKSKSAWIEKHLEFQKTHANRIADEQKFSVEELRNLASKATESIPKRTAQFAGIMNVSYNKITIRKQVSRWGSCSSKKNLNFNCLLMLCPKEVCDYVIIHELCHLKEMNHSDEFWKEVEKYCPDYKIHRKWLKDNGKCLIERLR